MSNPNFATVTISADKYRQLQDREKMLTLVEFYGGREESSYQRAAESADEIGLNIEPIDHNTHQES